MLEAGDIPIRVVPELPGQQDDLWLLRDNSWMQDTEVISNIRYWRGRWHVWMAFFSLHHPPQFILRKIDHYHSQKRAETYAQIFQRGIRKDARGTQKRTHYAYHICLC